MAGKLSWNLWSVLAVILFGLIVGVALAVLLLSLAGRVSLPVRLSGANFFLLLMFLGLLEFGDLYLLYSAFTAFERGGDDRW